MASTEVIITIGGGLVAMQLVSLIYFKKQLEKVTNPKMNDSIESTPVDPISEPDTVPAIKTVTVSIDTATSDVTIERDGNCTDADLGLVAFGCFREAMESGEAMATFMGKLQSEVGDRIDFAGIIAAATGPNVSGEADESNE